MNIIIAIIGGLIIGWIVATVMKGKLKSVEKQTRATNYMKKDSLNLTQSYERFLFRNVTKTKIQSGSNKAN